MRKYLLSVSSFLLLVPLACGTGEPPDRNGEPAGPDSVIVIPSSPLEVGL